MQQMRMSRTELHRRVDDGDRAISAEPMVEPDGPKTRLPGAIAVPQTLVDDLAEIVGCCGNAGCQNSARPTRRPDESGSAHVGEHNRIAAGSAAGHESGSGSDPGISPVSPIEPAIDDALAVSCRLDEDELASRSIFLRRELFSGAMEREEQEHGYIFHFPGDGEGNDNWKAKIDEFVTTERHCCSFFRIEVTFEPELGPISLRLTGPVGTKVFIRETFDRVSEAS